LRSIQDQDRNLRRDPRIPVDTGTKVIRSAAVQEISPPGHVLCRRPERAVFPTRRVLRIVARDNDALEPFDYRCRVSARSLEFGH
jgi:hypothetical protein